MFTTINIYETILNKYHVHYILKSCIYTGMTATSKFVLCHTRQHLNLRVVTSSYTIIYFIPCLEKYSQSEAKITVAYSAVCNE